MKKVIVNERETIAGVHQQFLQRWSPRALSDKTIATEKLERIFEATRWTPSCYNEQPWQIYTSNQDNFAQYLALLDEFNQKWAKHSAVIGFMVVNVHFSETGKINKYADFDCGAAWMSMTLQALQENVYVHAMGGINISAAEEYFNLTNEQRVLIGFVMGYMDDKAKLSYDLLSREKPSIRKPLHDIWVN